jgi:cobalamin biosynthesis protein CobT
MNNKNTLNRRYTMKLKKKDLAAAAVELNEVLGLDPEIDPTDTVGKLKAKIKEAGELVDPENDEFSDETWDVLEALEAAFRPVMDEAPAKEDEPEEDPDDEDDEDEDEEDEEEPEEDEDDEEEPEEDEDDEEEPEEDEDDEEDEEDEEEPEEEKTLAEILAATKKLKELKALVMEHDEFKPLRKKLDQYQGLAGPRMLKPEMWRVSKLEEPKKSKKSKKTNKPRKAAMSSTPGVNQTDIIRQAIKKKKKRTKVIAELAKQTGNDLKWAEYRMKTYERAYGELGNNDPKL